MTIILSLLSGLVGFISPRVKSTLLDFIFYNLCIPHFLTPTLGVFSFYTSVCMYMCTYILYVYTCLCVYIRNEKIFSEQNLWKQDSEGFMEIRCYKLHFILF